ncbi:CAP domain-containing protein [Oscillibacter sp. ER4]|uniref:CAP domain-containing protein n=1 Tax=Oscillibacter sp. ER4 TaxID=1519439 RepID=UPI000A741FCF|nr:CAP domain-containing protein [Oscillibacter sp. ER4]
MKRGSFAAGFLTCLLLAGVTTTAYAAGIMAERSTHRIFVDGREVQMEAYRIKGNNYVKLRDIGEQVGFNVCWDSNTKCVQVESKKPYTGEAPVTSAEAKPVEQPAQTDVAAAKQDIIDRTNALRCENGVAVLRVNDKLMQAAQVRADEIAASGVYSHARPDGRKSNTVTDSKYTGENIHSISELYLEQQRKTLSEAVVNLWSNSKSHADNMTSSRYGEIGVGLARGINQNGLDCWYCVQVFLLDGCEVTWVDTPASK